VTDRPGKLQHALALVEARMSEVLADSDPLVLQYIQAVADQRGKRLRPRLLVVCGELFGGAPPAATANCAACCELLHTATLIHDDVIDDAPTRRGSLTLNSRYGNEIAVIVGDYVLTLVLKSLSAERDFGLLEMLLDTAQELGLGVLEEVHNHNNFGLDIEKYYTIINYKTAALFSLCCRMGASLGGAEGGAVGLAGEYGTQLGMAFQIADDLLDLTRSELETGKPALSDLREGRITLPVIHGMLEQPSRIRQLVEDYQTTLEPAAGSALRSALFATGSVTFAALKAREFLEAARAAARSLRSLAAAPEWGEELERLEERVETSLPEEVAARV
jgi:octaprenyl-diphosphate synthase